MGYHRAGFEVVGVDTDPAAVARYPFPSVAADAVEVLTGPSWAGFRAGFDVIHASPPCQAYSALRHAWDRDYPDLLAPVLTGLRAWAHARGGVWVVENVPGAPLPAGSLTLCGTEFALSTVHPGTGRVWLRRHRVFACSIHLWGAGGCYCATMRGRTIGVYGQGDGGKGRGWKGTISQRRAVMGIDWMTRTGLAQAVPPAYTEHIGRQLADHLPATRRGDAA